MPYVCPARCFPQNYPENKVFFGLPMWDWHSDQTYPFEIMAGLDIDSSKRNIFLPQIIQDEKQWFTDCAMYFDEHHDPDAHYYISYRLKVAEELSRNRELEARLRKFNNITHLYSPYFYVLVPLLRACETVFLSNASFMILDCMAARSKVVKEYDHARRFTDDWRDNFMASAVDDYVSNPQATYEKFITNQGDAAKQFFDRVIPTQVGTPAY